MNNIYHSYWECHIRAHVNIAPVKVTTHYTKLVVPFSLGEVNIQEFAMTPSRGKFSAPRFL